MQLITPETVARSKAGQSLDPLGLQLPKRRRRLPYLDYRTANAGSLKRMVSDAKCTLYEARAAFVDGDHWQDGNAWGGPMPQPTHPGYHIALTQIRRGFVSRNVCAEICERMAGALIGRVPHWFTKPAMPESVAEDGTPELTDAEQRDTMAVDAALTTWWDSQKVHLALYEAVERGLATGRVYLRLFIPRRYLDNGALRSTSTLAEALRRIHVEVVEQDSAIAALDQESELPVLVYVENQDAPGGTILDARGTVTARTRTRAEVHYVATDGNTHMRVLQSDSETGADYDLGDLGGNTLLIELGLDSLLSPQVIQQQMALNKTLSMLSANGDSALFLERIFTNAMPAGEKVVDEKTGIVRFVPKPHEVGVGTTNYVGGIVTKDGQGGERITTPGVHYREPGRVQPFTDSQSAFYENMLSEVGQLYAVLSGDSEASGESRRQALADFLVRLILAKVHVDSVGQQLLLTALRLALTMSDEQVPTELELVFGAVLNPGPVPAEEMRLVMQMVEKRILSLPSAMSRLGVEDVDAEQALISSTPVLDVETRMQQVEHFVQLLNMSLSAQTAGELVGLEADVLERIVKELTPPATDGGDTDTDR